MKQLTTFWSDFPNTIKWHRFAEQMRLQTAFRMTKFITAMKVKVSDYNGNILSAGSNAAFWIAEDTNNGGSAYKRFYVPSAYTAKNDYDPRYTSNNIQAICVK